MSKPTSVEDAFALGMAWWEAYAILGFDTDGDTTPWARTDIPALIVTTAREMRKDYDEACDEVAERDAEIVRLTAERDEAVAALTQRDAFIQEIAELDGYHGAFGATSEEQWTWDTEREIADRARAFLARLTRGEGETK